MSPPANNNSPAPAAIASSVPAATIQLPTALLEKCFVPYTRNSVPTLHGHPIAVQNAQPPAADNALLLSPSLIDLALRVLKTEISKPADAQTLRVTALCTPKLDSALAVDAAVRYLAHHFKADVLVLDADDLAAAEHGVLGADFSSALWSLYARHYEISDELKAMSAVEKDAKSALDELAREEETLEQRKRALAQYVDDNAVAEQTEDDSASKTSDDDGAGESPPSARGTQEDPHGAGDTEPHDVETPRDAVHDPEHERPAKLEVPAPVEPPIEDDELAGLKQDVIDAERSVNDARTKAESSAKALADLKSEHAQRAEARAASYTTSLAWLRAFLRAGGSSRRRFLYLRNFGASSYVFLPLLHPLLRTISDSGLPVTVLAGFSRVPIMQWTDTDTDKNSERVKNKHTVYLTALETRSALLAYVKRKCTPEWRQSADNEGRATGLSDLFARAVIERYFVRKLARGSAETLRVGADANFAFAGALAVSLVSEPPMPRDFSTRLVLARHVRSLSKALSDDYKKTWPGVVETNVEDWLQMMKERTPDAKASVSRLAAIMYKDAALSTLSVGIAPWLPAQDALTTAEVFAAVEKWDIAQAELIASLALERDGPAKTADSAPSVAAQVKNAKDLDEYEKRLLGAIIDPATITTTYEDVCMQLHIIDTLRSVASLPLLYADAYSTGILGRESMAGLLLYGQPGTGKTMVCRALAKESGANMLQIQASTIRSMWHSEDEKLIHATFRRLGPCVIFIDEIEALFGSRARSGHIHRSTLTEFLQEMDGLKSASENRTNKIVIVGATNRPQDLDEAVLRRLPRRVLVDLPGTSEREKIIKHYLTGEKTDETVDIAALAARTPHYSGSDLKHVVFSAALSAFKDTVPDLWTPPSPNGEKSRPLPQRVIGSHHFDKALCEVVASATTHLASISELRNWGGSMGV